MLDFYMFMSVISVIAIPLGLIFPPLVLFWLPKRNRTRKAVMGYFGVFLIVFATLGGLSTSELTDEQVAVKEIEKEEAQDVKDEKKVAKVEVKEDKSKKKTEPKPKDESKVLENKNSACKGIDINSANEAQVQDIIHIGSERSSDLIRLRPYTSVENLNKIKGIGPVRITDIVAEGKACVK